MAQEVTSAMERSANPINAVQGSRNEAMEAADVFGKKPQPRMQGKLHDMMYSGHTTSVDDGVSVSVSDLIPTQKKVWVSHVDMYHSPRTFDDAPIVASYKGKSYVIDGHHRIAAAIRRGEKSIKVIRYNLQ